MQERLIDFNVPEDEKFTEIVSGSLSQPTGEKVLPVEFDLASKKKIHKYLKRLLQYSSLPNYISVGGLVFSIYFTPKYI